ncbi:MAG: hypothetical protein WD512_10275, partial [Candidatus Paceibacterota bacterium]
MMRLKDVLSWIESHPNQYMVRGGKSADAKAKSAAAKTAAFKARNPSSPSSSSSVTSSPKAGGGTLFTVKLSDSVGVSEGGKLPSGSTSTSSGGVGGRQIVVSVGGLTPQQANQKIKEEETHSQQKFVQERIEEQENQLKFENLLREREAQAREERYNERYPTKYGRYVKGGKIIGVTTGNIKDLLKIQKQISGSIITQNKFGENYQLLSAEDFNLANPANLKQFNEQIEKEGGEPYKILEKNPSDGIAYFKGLQDSVTVDEPTPDFPVGKNKPVDIDKNKPTKYTAYVGSNTLKIEQAFREEPSDVKAID